MQKNMVLKGNRFIHPSGLSREPHFLTRPFNGVAAQD
jgi:hypothetical protein